MNVHRGGLGAIRTTGLVRRAAETVAGRIDGGGDGYDRARHLPRIIAVGPDEVADDSPGGRNAILRKLARALRAERNRGRTGHWTYDLNRHIALHQAYAAERRAAHGRPDGQTEKAPPRGAAP